MQDKEKRWAQVVPDKDVDEDIDLVYPWADYTPEDADTTGIVNVSAAIGAALVGKSIAVNGRLEVVTAVEMIETGPDLDGPGAVTLWLLFEGGRVPAFGNAQLH
jgi:hypothetical protein